MSGPSNCRRWLNEYFHCEEIIGKEICGQEISGQAVKKSSRKQPRSAEQKSEISLPTYAGLIGLTVFVFNLRTCLKFVREQDAMLADANGPSEVRSKVIASHTDRCDNFAHGHFAV
jgi:hypothetical protein